MENRDAHTPEAKEKTEFAWGPAMAAGAVASIVFQGLEMLLVPLSGGGSPWGPARMIAAMVLGQSVLPPPATFDLRVVLVALVVDVVLAMIYAVALNWLTNGWPRGRALFAGAVFGVALYFVNFYGLTALFPWFEMGRNGATVLTHIVFSLVAVMVYGKLRDRRARRPAPLPS